MLGVSNPLRQCGESSCFECLHEGSVSALSLDACLFDILAYDCQCCPQMDISQALMWNSMIGESTQGQLDSTNLAKLLDEPSRLSVRVTTA